MSWFGPQDCNCGCEGGVCECNDSEETYQSFSGTPTIKVTISGISLGTLNADKQAGIGESDWLEYDFSALSGLNGTYFFALPKTEEGCIDWAAIAAAPFPLGQSLINITITRRRRRYNHGSCLIHTDETTTPTHTAGITLSETFVVSLNWGIAGEVTLRGCQGHECRNEFDPTLSDRQTSISISGFTSPITFNCSDGEVWFQLLAASASHPCGIPSDLPGLRVIGSITSELIDL